MPKEITVDESEYLAIKEKSAKWDALQNEYDDLTACDDEGNDLNPDVDLMTLGELLQKHFGYCC